MDFILAEYYKELRKKREKLLKFIKTKEQILKALEWCEDNVDELKDYEFDELVDIFLDNPNVTMEHIEEMYYDELITKAVGG